jgi:amino acid transporter
MSRAVPHAGSVFAYATEGLGRPAGFLAGWLAMLDYLLIPSVAYLFCGIALHALVPAVPAWIFTVIAFAATTALNFAGVAAAARAGLVVLVVEIVVLTLLLACAAAVLAGQGPARPLASPWTGFSGLDVSAVTGAISIAVLSFLGFDAIASFAEEHAGDARQVGVAILGCLGIAGVCFVAQAWVAALLSPALPADLLARPERQGTAFYDVVRQAIGPWMATLLAATKAVGPAFAAMTAQAAAARLLYGMARDGRLPTALAGIGARSRAPSAALSATALVTLAVSVWAARRADGLDLLVSIVDVGALGAFTLLHASVIGYFAIRRRAAGGAAHVVVPAIGAAVTISVMAAASRPAQIVAAVWLAVGVAVHLAGKRQPGSAA